MSNPPDEIDFFALFEAEPELADPKVPWVYNTATYRLERDGRVIMATIGPSYSSFKAAVILNGELVAEATVNAFTDIEIISDRSREVLMIRFGEFSVSALFLTLKPAVTLVIQAGSDA